MPWIVSVTLTIALPLVVVYTYVGRKFYSALILRSGMARPKAVRLIVTAILILNLFPIILLVSYLAAGRSASALSSGEHWILDLVLVYPFWFALVIFTEIFLVLIVSDLVKLLLFPIYRTYRHRWRRIEANGIFVAGLIVAIYCIVTIALNTWSLRIDRHQIPLPDSARSLDGLRIALIADVQGDWRTSPSRIRAFAPTLCSLQAILFPLVPDTSRRVQRFWGTSTLLSVGLRP